jgi:hypothetical protein
VQSNVGPLSSLAIGVEFHVAENAQTGFLTPAPLTKCTSTSRLHDQVRGEAARSFRRYQSCDPLIR